MKKLRPELGLFGLFGLMMGLMNVGWSQGTLTIQNPSFEENLPPMDTICVGATGTKWYCPSPGKIQTVPRKAGDPGIFGMNKIDPWTQCSGTVDLLPNAPQLAPTMKASDGDWYFGLVCDAQNSPASEAFGQPLSAPFTPGTEYTFKIDLAHQLGGYAQGNAWGLDKPGSLFIYGQKSSCGTTGSRQLLWQSPKISHQEWKTYEIKFTPTDAWTHIFISMSGNNSCSEGDKSNILVDRVGGFVPGGLQVNTPIEGKTIACSESISGVADKTIDTLTVTGRFNGSVKIANLTNSNKSWDLSFEYPKTFSGWDTLHVSATFVDPGVLDQKIDVPVYVHPKITDFDVSMSDVRSPVSFTDKSQPLWNNSTKWSWNFGDASTSSNQSPSHTYANWGTKTVTQVIDYNGNPKCADTVIKDIIVPNRPLTVTITSPTDNAKEKCQATVTGTVSEKPDSLFVSIGGNNWVKATVNSDLTWSAKVFSTKGTSGVQNLIAKGYAPGTTGFDTNKVSFDGATVTALFDYSLSSNKDSLSLTNKSINGLSTVDSTAFILPGNVRIKGNAQYLINKPGDYPVSLIAYAADGCRDQKDSVVAVAPAQVSANGNALFDEDHQGRVDKMTVQLKDKVPETWLSNMTIDLAWMGANDTLQNFRSSPTQLSWAPTAIGQTIIWKLPSDLKSVQLPDTSKKPVLLHPMTTGFGNGVGEAWLNQGFVSGTKDSNYRLTVVAVDSLKPLIGKARILPAKQSDLPDTLRFDFSEAINPDAVKNTKSFGFWINSTKQPNPNLDWFVKTTRVGWTNSNKRLTALLPASERTNLSFALRPGDSVKALDCMECLTDIPGQTATALSPWVPLEGISLGGFQSNTMLTLTSDNHYTTAFSALEPVSRGQTLADVSKGRGGVLYSLPFDDALGLNNQWEYELSYYSGLGDFVANLKGTIKCTDALFNGNCKAFSGVFIPWNLRDQNGNKVGSGVFVERAKLNKESRLQRIGVHRLD